LHSAHPLSIDALLLECLLPDGKPAVLLAAADQRSVSAVLMSGDPLQADLVDPSQHFLTKPFSLATFFSALDTARR
jgi:hypothetical protein